MKSSKVTRYVAILGSLLCASAVAQTRFCVGGDLDGLSQAQRIACNAKMQAVKLAANALHAPENWHFVVVCGEEGWKAYTDFSHGPSSAQLDVAAETNLEQHETFLRGDRLDLSKARSLERVVAHEIAGIMLHSKDETAINNQMSLWFGPSSAATGL